MRTLYMYLSRRCASEMSGCAEYLSGCANWKVPTSYDSGSSLFWVERMRKWNEWMRRVLEWMRKLVEWMRIKRLRPMGTYFIVDGCSPPNQEYQPDVLAFFALLFFSDLMVLDLFTALLDFLVFWNEIRSRSKIRGKIDLLSIHTRSLSEFILGVHSTVRSKMSPLHSEE